MKKRNTALIAAFIIFALFSSALFAKAKASAEQTKTEYNTITVINTDEIKIVTDKDGNHGFQLKNLDMLWGMRGVSCAMVALFLILIITFYPASGKQGLTLLCFLGGCALTLGFYPLGISPMIYGWNKTYGIACALMGLIMTLAVLATANKLRRKIKALEEEKTEPSFEQPPKPPAPPF